MVKTAGIPNSTVSLMPPSSSRRTFKDLPSPLASTPTTTVACAEARNSAILLDGLRQCRSCREFVSAFEFCIEQMDGAVSAHRQAGSQNSRRFLAAHREDDDFPSMFFFQPKSLFQSVIVGFAGDECQILIFDPGLRLIDDQPRRRIRHGLHATDDFHGSLRVIRRPPRFYSIL